jgi:hypothetical protein
MGIDCAFYGVLARDPARKTSQNGNPYLKLNVREGSGDAAQWIVVRAFNMDAELGARLKKGASHRAK